jgi:integrase
MSMQRKPSFPSYPKRPHKTGQARIRLDGRDRYIGAWRSPASYAEYERLLAEWRAGQAEARTGPAAAAGTVRTINDLLARWAAHADQHYRNPDGSPKSERDNFRLSLRPLQRLYGHTLIQDFGPRALKALQRAMVDGSWMTPQDRATAERLGKGTGWARRVINRSIGRVRTMFRWAESEELVLPATLHALECVAGLQVGQYGVRETADVPPVPEADLAATLPQFGPIVRELVECLLLTGARPSELVKVKPGDINRTGRVEIARGYWVDLGDRCWCVQPAKHKTAHKGHRRVILLGPRAQALLGPLLDDCQADAYLFSPRRARARRHALMRARRKSRVQPSQVCRAKARPDRQLGDVYTRRSLGSAVAAACDRAKVARWTVYMLRHNAGTRMASEFGPDVARIVLGHRTFDATRIYALDAMRKAAEAVEKIG